MTIGSVLPKRIFYYSPASLNLWRFSESLYRVGAALEVILGGQGDFGQEICGEVERRGARTAGGDDPRGQASGTVADEGAHPAEGGPVGGGRRLERQHDLGCVGHQHQYRLHPASTGRRRPRGGADPQIQSELRPAADFRRGGGGEIARPDLLAGARGVRALEPAPARGEGRRIEHRREGQRQHDRKDSKKNSSNRTAIGNGSSRRTPTPASSPR